MMSGHQVVKLPTGQLVASLSEAETLFMAEEIFDRNCYSLGNLISLQPGDTVLDVGANIGLFALQVTDKYDDVTIHCFEPAPSTFSALKKTLLIHQHLNPITSRDSKIEAAQSTPSDIVIQSDPLSNFNQDPNSCSENATPNTSKNVQPVSADQSSSFSRDDQRRDENAASSEDSRVHSMGGISGSNNEAKPNGHILLDMGDSVFSIGTCRAVVHNCGMSEKELEADMKYYPHMPGNSTLHPQWKEAQRDVTSRHYFEDASNVRTQFTTLGHAIQTLGLRHVGLLKIDTEGHEFCVLSGLRMGDWLKIRQMVVEVHPGPDGMVPVEEMTSLLHKRGFRTESRPDPMTGNAMVWAYRYCCPLQP